MAQTQQPRQGGAAGFVDHIVSDPENVPDVRVFRGFEGRSATVGYVRVYATPNLKNSVEFPREALLHEVAVPDHPLGAKIFFVKGDAPLAQKVAAGAATLRRYFAGSMAGAAAAGAAAMGAARATPAAAMPLGARRWARAPRRDFAQANAAYSYYYYYYYTSPLLCSFGITC
jgi:hypothetical protein